MLSGEGAGMQRSQPLPGTGVLLIVKDQSGDREDPHVDCLTPANLALLLP